MTIVMNGLRRFWAVAALATVLGTAFSANAASWHYYSFGNWLNAPAPQPSPGAEAWGSCPHSSVWPMNEADVGVFLHIYTTNNLSHANVFWESDYPWSYTSPYSPAMTLEYDCQNALGGDTVTSYGWWYPSASGYSPDVHCPTNYPTPWRARCKTATYE
jgi:hypothetical protein